MHSSQEDSDVVTASSTSLDPEHVYLVNDLTIPPLPQDTSYTGSDFTPPLSIRVDPFLSPPLTLASDFVVPESAQMQLTSFAASFNETELSSESNEDARERRVDESVEEMLATISFEYSTYRPRDMTAPQMWSRSRSASSSEIDSYSQSEEQITGPDRWSSESYYQSRSSPHWTHHTHEPIITTYQRNHMTKEEDLDEIAHDMLSIISWNLHVKLQARVSKVMIHIIGGTSSYKLNGPVQCAYVLEGELATVTPSEAGMIGSVSTPVVRTADVPVASDHIHSSKEAGEKEPPFLDVQYLDQHGCLNYTRATPNEQFDRGSKEIHSDGELDATNTALFASDMEEVTGEDAVTTVAKDSSSAQRNMGEAHS
ncbi:hypothetical protein J1614_001365 [Plenodomus biglobosus]|nr:hypothetical protein J1614_001365 [Plenodomus biglobosus]